MKKKRKIRFFNRPVKIGIGAAGIGASLEFGSPAIYEVIQDPKLIFWLEVLKYLSYIVGVIFASGGVVKQAKEDLDSIKLGEKVKDIVKVDEELKAKPVETFEEEEENKRTGLNEVFDFARDLLNRRKQK